jgi:hypothetical protein
MRPLTRLRLPTVALYIANATHFDETNGNCMINGKDNDGACPVYDIIGNELEVRNVTENDGAAYNNTAYKTYEYTFINNVTTNANLGETSPLPAVSGGAEPALFIVHPSSGNTTNNVYWSVDIPQSNETALCGDHSPYSTVTGSCANSKDGTELSTNGAYIANAMDGNQYIAQLTDGFQSITGTTNMIASNLLGQNSNRDPASTIYTVNSNDDRHSVYWLVAFVDANHKPAADECINRYTQRNAPPLLVLVGISVFLELPPPPITSPPQYQMVFWVNQTKSSIIHLLPDTNPSVNGPCSPPHNLDSGFLNDTDSQNFLTGGRTSSEWAIYSTPSASYKAPLWTFGPHFNNTEGTKGPDGEYCCATNGLHTNGMFLNGTGDDYAFYTIGFSLGLAQTPDQALSLDQIIDSSTAYTVNVALP